MNRPNPAPRVPLRSVIGVLAAVLLASPALADEAKARARIDRARELQASGGTDVARWLRELRSARQALQGVEEGARQVVLGEIDAVLAAGMEPHLSKAGELARSPGGLRRADLYYLKPTERALKDYADDANQAKYGALIEELRREGQEAERRAAEERAGGATPKPKPAPPPPNVEAPDAGPAKPVARADAEGPRPPHAEPTTPEPDVTEPTPRAAPTPSEARPSAESEAVTGPSRSARAEEPEQSAGAIALAIAAFLLVVTLALGGSALFAFYVLGQVRAGNLGAVAAVGFGGFGGLIALVGVGVAFEDPMGGAVTIAFGAVFVGVGLAARKLFQAPEGTRDVVVSRHEGQVLTREGRPVQRLEEVRVRVDADASEAEVAAAQREWKRSLWRRRADWVEGSILDDAGQYGGLATWGAALWSLLALVLALVWWFSEEGVIGLAALGVGTMALALVAVAARIKLHESKFGASRLVLTGTPLFLGERLKGTIHTGVQRHLDPRDGFLLRLRCVHSYEQSSSRDDSTVRKRDVLWEHETSVDSRRSAETPDRLDVQVDLEVPADQAETSNVARDGVLWELELYADLPGLDYRATFELPVFQRDDDPWVGDGAASTETPPTSS